MHQAHLCARLIEPGLRTGACCKPMATAAVIRFGCSSCGIWAMSGEWPSTSGRACSEVIWVMAHHAGRGRCTSTLHLAYILLQYLAQSGATLLCRDPRVSMLVLLTAVGVKSQRLEMGACHQNQPGWCRTQHRIRRQKAGTLLTRPGVGCAGSASSGSRLMSLSACSQV